MTTFLYTKLNQYFERDADINKVIRFLKNGVYPIDVETMEERGKFTRKFKGFKVIDNKLVYEPKGLTVIPKRSVNKTLKDEYKDNFGSGITNFYKTIRTKYLNIKRDDVKAFIKKQVNKQLIGNYRHRTNKPIIALYPNQLWCIDLIEIDNNLTTRNKNFRYIVNVIDVFSRKLWLEPMKVKTSISTRNAFRKIIERAGVKPKYLISDNGTEFEKDFNEYCKENEIKQRFNRAYAPEANGIVERHNKEIRKLMKNVFIENGNNVWINNIRKIENIHNETYTSSIKNIPNKVWTTRNKPYTAEELFSKDEDPIQREQLNAYSEIKKNARRRMAEFKDTEYNEGDYVRLRMDEIFKNVKALVKAGKTKNLIITYSPSIFRIFKKITPRRRVLDRSKYILQAVENGRLLLTKVGGKPRQVYGHVLIKVDKNDHADISNADAMRINGVEANRNDATT